MCCAVGGYRAAVLQRGAAGGNRPAVRVAFAVLQMAAIIVSMLERLAYD